MSITRLDVQHFAVSLALIAFAVALPGEQLFAARNDSLVDPVASPYELVVVEIEGCTYCPILRRDAIPAFQASPESREVGLRFLDLNAAEANDLKLTEGPVTVVPTLLLVKGNQEVGRASGYMGPEGFVFAARWLMRNASPSQAPTIGRDRLPIDAATATMR